MKKIGLTGIYFPGALEALRANVPEGFELVEGSSQAGFSQIKRLRLSSHPFES